MKILFGTKNIWCIFFFVRIPTLHFVLRQIHKFSWLRPCMKMCERRLSCGSSTRACPSARRWALRERGGTTTQLGSPWSVTPTTFVTSAARRTSAERPGATWTRASGTLSTPRSWCAGAAVMSAKLKCAPSMAQITWSTRFISKSPFFVSWWSYPQCRYCCSVAVFFCFGTTHFCNVSYFFKYIVRFLLSLSGSVDQWSTRSYICFRRWFLFFRAAMTTSSEWRISQRLSCLNAPWDRKQLHWTKR